MRYPKHFNIALLAMALMLAPISSSASAAYAPLVAANGKPKVAAHLVRLENDVVELALQVLAPGKILEAIRIDNLGGVSSHWRSDGKDKAAPLSVSKGGTKLSSGAQAMNLALGGTEALFSLSLTDNGAFAGKNTEFRVTVFFVGGERAMYSLSAGDFPTVAPVQAEQRDVNTLNAKRVEDLLLSLPGKVRASSIEVKGDMLTLRGLEESNHMAAEQGDPNAQFKLATMYFDGHGVPQDYERAAEWYRKAAEQGDIDAQNNLAFMYQNGLGVPQDDRQAAHWLYMAAEQGRATSQVALGSLYALGRGVVQDYEQAAHWFVKAAEQGNIDAQWHLGSMYLNGQGIAQNYEQAVELLYKAAVQGHVDAQYNLGVVYYHGHGVSQDNEQAWRWYHKAAEQGNELAQRCLIFMYENGHGVTKNSEQAAYWLGKVAEQGDADAQFGLGSWYRTGHGVAQDDHQAIEWFRKAAEQGYDKAQHALGLQYAEGRGVAKNDSQAVEWFRKAAEQGYAAAQYSLSLMYTYGRGVTQDDRMAVYWSSLAAEQKYIPSHAVRVSSKEELKRALNSGSNASTYIVLIKDIYVGQWVPVGGFHGTIDGQGHIIKGLRISSRPYAGLLSWTNATVTIKNLGVEIDWATSPEEGISFGKGEERATRAGGLIGWVHSGLATIENCFVAGDIEASIHYPVLSNIDAKSYAGGLIGEASGAVAISNCYAIGSVSAYASGRRFPKNSRSFAGGLIGYGNNNVTITNSYTNATIAARGQNSNAGGFIGGGTASVTNSYYVEGKITNKKNNLGTAIPHLSIKNSSTFPAMSGWDFKSPVWGYTKYINDGCPDLAVFSKPEVIYIKTGDELAVIGGPRSEGTTYILENDIGLPGGWIPIDNFRGTLDGKGHTISNLHINGAIPNYGSVGLFGEVRGGDVNIKNIHIKAANIYANCTTGDDQSFAFGGGLIGACVGGNIYIENCTFNGDIFLESHANYSISAIVSSLPLQHYIGTIPRWAEIALHNFEIGLNALTFLISLKSKGNAFAGGLIGFIKDDATVKIINSSAHGSVAATSSKWPSWIFPIFFDSVQDLVSPKNNIKIADLCTSYAGGLIGFIESSKVTIKNSTPYNKDKLTAHGRLEGVSPHYEKHYTGAISGNNSSFNSQK